MFDTYTDPVIGLEFVQIPAPPEMSYTLIPYYRQQDLPHPLPLETNLVKTFYMARTVLTRRHMSRLKDSLTQDSVYLLPSRVRSDCHEDDLPLLGLQFDHIGVLPSKARYNLIQILSNKDYRVPTQAEWEWAAQGGENFEQGWPHGLDQVAWYRDNSDGALHPVATKKPNGYGLYDMIGNIRQYTSTIKNEGVTIVGSSSWDRAEETNVTEAYWGSFDSACFGIRLCFSM